MLVKILNRHRRQVAQSMMVLSLVACSSDEESLEDPVQSEQSDPGDGDLSVAEVKPEKDKKGAEENGEENQSNAKKEPISDDGYDDDWNNMGSQQQKQQANKNNKNQQQATEEEPLQNAPLQNAKNIQPVAEEPAEQVPAEPPIDEEPAPVANIPENPVPAAVPAPAPITGPVTIASGAPLIRNDVEPVLAKLFWVGYDYLERDSLIRIEMVTRGSPKYNIFQERNKSNQPELVVRFFNTKLRDKVKRDIDASEFRSPVAFVRMRPDEEENSVDVIMTLRDAVQPRMYTKYGNIMLTFQIPDHYFGNSAIGSAPVAKAEVLPNANIMPEIDTDSEIPEGLKIAKAFINDPGADAFKDAPADGGEIVPVNEAPANPAGNEVLPADFDQEPVTNGNLEAPLENVATNDLPPEEGDEGEALFDENAPSGSENTADGENFDFEGNVGNVPSQGAPPPQDLPPAQGAPAPNEVPAQENSAPLDPESSDSEELEEDKLEDFDDGKGESAEEIDKFDVRLKAGGTPYARLAQAGYLVTSFSLAGVAQDEDFGDEEEVAEQGNGNVPANNAQGNVPANNQGNLGQNGGGNVVDGEEGEGNFPGAEGNVGNQGNGNLLGEGGQGNATNLDTADAPPVNEALGNNTGNLGDTTNATGNALGNALLNQAVPVQNAAAGAVGDEPPVDGNADLAGEETEGSESEEAPTPSSGGRPIKLDFRGAPLTEVIRVLSEESGVNFVVPPEVGTKRIYINVNGVPFNDALKAVLESNALGMAQLGPNLVRIDTLENLVKDRKAEEDRRKAELRLRPTKILVHRLSYAKADEAAKMLGDMLGAASEEDKRIKVQVDNRTNSVIINAPPNDLAMVKALLDRIDLETPQVRIASRIVEVLKTFADNFGISWGGPFNLDQGRGLGFGNLVFPNYMTSRYSIDAGGRSNQTGNFGFHFGSINGSQSLDLALSMQESKNNVEILQSGNVIVEDNQDAEIVAGRSDYFAILRAGVNAQGQDLTEVQYNLRMAVKPHITADGAVQMKLTIESDNPSSPASATGIAAKNRRLLNTSLLRRSGETAVIGGIYNTQKEQASLGIPGLSSIPIIGALFRQSKNEEQKRELMVMVTPTILTSSKAFASDGSESFSNVAINDAGGEGQSQENFGNNGLDGGGNQNNGGGNQNAGEGNFGTQGTSNQNAGNQNAGNQNAGNQNAGNQNAGNQNAANQNAGNQNAVEQEQATDEEETDE